MSCSSGSSASTCTSIGNVVTVAGLSAANIGVSTDITITAGSGQVTVNVLRVKLKRVAGTAANFTPRLYNLAGAAAGSINQQFEGTATVVATLFDVACSGVVFLTDTAGLFYLEPGPNAGADNQFNYEISYEIVG
jgi:hypothetical protein